MPDPWLRRDWIAPGMALIEQGGRTGQLYVLKDGELEVLRDGRHVTTIRTPGAVIGEMSVLLDLPQTATVRAVSEVDFFVIDNAIDVLKTHPDWLLQIARLLAQRVNATTAQLTRDKSDDTETLVLPQNFMSSWSDPTV
ncbi:MAG: cyclic nucleotide-binding domain-containing protein [Devosia nanyangense]|uniref:Cyclic nucleotide-binding domain-containing protein n=1 Tax=Devosia nanyangense TaxID=1228055 RepID=A0A933L1T1_9HYPH|nr:cyclic nucleotide-binding domain-containing protein [Devosia nanyangense]